MKLAAQSPLRTLSALKRSPGLPQALPISDKRDSMTPGPRSSPALVTDPLKATCFNCGQIRHFTSSCPDPHTTPRINEIEKDDIKTSDDEVTDEKDADSESEN